MIVRRSETDVILVSDPSPQHQMHNGKVIDGAFRWDGEKYRVVPYPPTMVTEVLVIPLDFLDAWVSGHA